MPLTLERHAEGHCRSAAAARLASTPAIEGADRHDATPLLDENGEARQPREPHDCMQPPAAPEHDFQVTCKRHQQF